MSGSARTRRHILSPQAAWTVWMSMIAAMVLQILLQFLVLRWMGHSRIRNPWSWVAYALAGIALAPVVAGMEWWRRFVLRAPSERSRVVRNARERWLAAEDPGDSDAKTFAVATIVAEYFHGRALGSWALMVSGGLIASFSLHAVGPRPPLLVALATWFVAMLVAAPNRSRRESYAVARLRAAGLTDEEARTLWHRALELVRARTT